MDEITQDQKHTFVSIFFGGLVDRTLYERGVPNWLRAAPSKILAIRANLDASVSIFGVHGWLTNKESVPCSLCGSIMEPGSTLYVGHKWMPWCSTCELAEQAQAAARSAAYDVMVAERSRAAATRRNQMKAARLVLPGQLELLKSDG